MSNLFDEIYIRSASPPLRYEDYMGIDIPTRQELIANYTINNKIYLYLSINNEILKEYKFNYATGYSYLPQKSASISKSTRRSMPIS